MIYEVCELLATHLRHPTMGVNALAASVPLGAGDPALEEVNVASEFDAPYLPLGKIPASVFKGGPAVFVRRGDAMGEFAPPSAPEVILEDGRVQVAILALYPRESAHSLDVENRRLSALLRVIRRSVGSWFEDAPIAARVLRHVCVVGPAGGAGPAVRVVPLVGFPGGEDSVDVCAGTVLLDVTVTDRWAEGITPLTP